MPSPDTDQLIIDAVTNHYATQNTPFYLAELGKFFHSNDITIPNGIRFKDYLKSRFHGRLLVVQDTEDPARIAIVPPEHEQQVLQQLSGHTSDLVDDSRIDHTRLPFALIAAFCKIPLPGTRVYFHITPPFRYETHMQAPDDSYVEIDERFRLKPFQGESVHALSSTDKQELYHQIEKWANDKPLDLRDFYYVSSMKPTTRSKQPVELEDNALKRLLNAQEPELRRRLRIPGDIADTLMRLP